MLLVFGLYLAWILRELSVVLCLFFFRKVMNHIWRLCCHNLSIVNPGYRRHSCLSDQKIVIWICFWFTIYMSQTQQNYQQICGEMVLNGNHMHNVHELKWGGKKSSTLTILCCGNLELVLPRFARFGGQTLIVLGKTSPE